MVVIWVHAVLLEKKMKMLKVYQKKKKDEDNGLDRQFNGNKPAVL